MKKPSNYEETQAAGEFTPIELGGHIMIIKSVEETLTRETKKPMLKIFLDTAPEDKQPKYFEEQFRKDIRPDKTWGCIVYQTVEDKDGNTSKGFKTFTTSVEKSNSGFLIPWGDNFAASFKGKKVGAVFGKEQYLNKDFELKYSSKVFWFRSVDMVGDVDVPADRLLPPEKQNMAVGSSGNDGFMNIPDGVEDEGLPFA